MLSNNELILYLLCVIGAYLLGSVPSSVWIGKLFYQKDVRDFGSGNAGAANTFRVLGVYAGIPALVLDILKGIASVSLIFLLPFIIRENSHIVTYQIILGIAAVMGHIFPVFAGFRGGKGVATLLGIALTIVPGPTIVALGTFMVIAAITKIISVGSISAGLVFPVSVIFIFHYQELSLIIFSLTVFVLLVVTHRKNIQRIIKGNENKANFLIRKSKRETA